MDYTVNPGVGFPHATGPEGSGEPVDHVLPAWDCIAGPMRPWQCSRPSATGG